MHAQPTFSIVESMRTAGSIGTVPIAQADGSLSMGSPAPAAHAASHAALGGDPITTLGTHLVTGSLGFDAWGATHPMLRSKGDDLDLRLGDDSARTDLWCLGIIAESRFRLNPTGYLYWNGQSQIRSPADGDILLRDAAGSDFGLLILGYNSSAYPALGREGTLLASRLGDDSAYTGIRASDFTIGTGSSVATRFPTFFAANPISADPSELRFYSEETITLSQMSAVVDGGTSPSVAWTVRYGTNKSDTGTEVVTGGSTTTSKAGHYITSFDSGTIPANNWVWLELVTVSTGANAPDSFSVTLHGKIS